MEYTVQKLAGLAGVSARTLRYYDRIGLLRPAGVSEGGYRLYGAKEVDLLQQILFFRELGFALKDIRAIMADPAFDRERALLSHRELLLEQRERLSCLIQTLDGTLSEMKGEKPMQDREKFEGFKRELIEKNEAEYGEEIRRKYGDAQVDASNAKMMGMSIEKYEEMQAVEQALKEKLKEAMQAGEPTGPLAREAAALHKRWLGYTWGSYSAEAHRGLVQMYVDDPRFTAYYDAISPGAATFLRDAVAAYLGEE